MFYTSYHGVVPPATHEKIPPSLEMVSEYGAHGTVQFWRQVQLLSPFQRVFAHAVRKRRRLFGPAVLVHALCGS